MKKNCAILGSIFFLVVFLLSACEPTAGPDVGPTSPTAPPVPQPTSAPEPTALPFLDVQGARNAALAYLRESYASTVPPAGLEWTEERLTAEGLLGAETYQYTSADWVIVISYPVVAPDALIYHVAVSNQVSGFRWEGELDADGQVTAISADNYDKWNTYTNAKLGYTLRYPSGVAVLDGDLDASVQFSGPLVDNEWWPVLSVGHPDAAFFSPPAGSDVFQWLAEQTGNTGYDAEREIAGLPTAHIRHPRSPQSYAVDEYYFIQGEQLYCITLLHTADKEDWDLYNLFLNSFRFE